jgi:tRNA(Ile)-lysidine synthase
VEEGRSPEGAARKARYGFLEATLKEWNGDVIALGQHLDDQAETVLIHLLHGSGLRGLGGIRPVNGHYIRPLLEISRADILDYVTQMGLDPRQDETNEDTSYLRNAIRHKVIPVLKERNPDFAAAAGRIAGLAREEDGFLDDLARDAFNALVVEDKYAVLYKIAGKEPDTGRAPGISVNGLMELNPVLARRALRIWIDGAAGLAVTDLAGVERIYKSARFGRVGAMTEAYGGIKVIKGSDSLVLLSQGGSHLDQQGARTPSADSFEHSIAPGCKITFSGGANISVRLIDGFDTSPVDDKKPFECYLCGWPTEGRLPVFRRRRPGDWLQMPYGRKKLKDMFIEKRVPRDLRDLLPVLAFDAQVLWVPGVVKALSPYGPENQIEFMCYV